MALHLSERSSLKRAVDSVPVDAIELVVKAIDGQLMKDLLKYIADEIVSEDEEDDDDEATTCLLILSCPVCPIRSYHAIKLCR